MSEIALRVDRVSKKFRKGEVYDSLRDLVPGLVRRALRGSPRETPERELWALRDISFELQRGQALGIIGANGAGKSTMLKLISRIMRPTTGTIELKGRLSALIEVSAGFHPDLTGRENVYLNGTILGMRRAEIDAKFDEIVEFSGLSEFLDMPVKRYSSGMYARLGFAVAAHVNPDVLIVDEVLSVGDYAFQQKCIERMKQVLRSGTTVLFVSHNLKSIAEFCSLCLLLDRGVAELYGPSHDVLRSYMNRNEGPKRVELPDAPVVITKVSFRDEFGEQLRYRSGQKAWVEVELTARERCEKIAIVLYYRDEQHYRLFNTSNERLGYGNISLDAGQIYSCTFELTMNFGGGVFRPCIAAFRYDNEREFDVLEPAATIYVTSDVDVGGAVNCFPKVVKQEIRNGAPAAVNGVLAEAEREPAALPQMRNETCLSHE